LNLILIGNTVSKPENEGIIEHAVAVRAKPILIAEVPSPFVTAQNELAKNSGCRLKPEGSLTT
jgi:hypothetical protein